MKTYTKTTAPQVIDVVANDLCIACGACIEACPAKVIKPAYSEQRGAQEVEILSTAQCTQCPKPCDAVCPSQTVDFSKLIDSGTTPIGPIRELYIGHSPEYWQNGVSSSGGVMRMLIRSALESGTNVVCLADTVDGSNGGGGEQVDRLTELSDLDRVPGSVYHSVSYNGAIKLIREAPAKTAIVATPCQLAGLEKYFYQCEPELRDKIALRLGIICGWMFSNHAISSFAVFHGLGPDWQMARYRGEDQVGRLKIQVDGKLHRFRRRDHTTFYDRNIYAASFSSNLNRMRCLVCEDHLNVLADVAVGDAWLERTSGKKLSIVVARTVRGSEALAACTSQGKLVLQPALEADLIESQSKRLIHGWGAREIAAELRRKNIKPPLYIYNQGGQLPPPAGAGPQVGSFTPFLFKLVRRRWYWLYLFFYVGRVMKQRVLARLGFA